MNLYRVTVEFELLVAAEDDDAARAAARDVAFVEAHSERADAFYSARRVTRATQLKRDEKSRRGSS